MRHLLCLSLLLSMTACGYLSKTPGADPSDPSTSEPQIPVTVTASYTCFSPAMSDGKQLNVTIEDFGESLRRYHVRIQLDNGFSQSFDADGSTKAVALHGIDETIKAGYGLGEDANYQLAFDGTQISIDVVGDENPHSASALGIPPADCAKL